MHRDKMMRASGDSLEGQLLLAAKRAMVRGDESAQRNIAAQVESLAKVAQHSDDKSLKSRVWNLFEDLKRVADEPRRSFVIETKAVAHAFRDESVDTYDASASSHALGTIEGYGSTFGNRDFGGDVVMPGAFTASLARWKKTGRWPPMLAVHEMRQFPVGAWTEMSEDSYGLRVKGEIADTPRGREAWALINMTPSALDGLSIGFAIDDEDVDRAGSRLLKKVELFELSLVHLPMNDLARLGRPKAIATHTRDLDAQIRRAVALVNAGSNVVSIRSGEALSSDDEDDVLEALNGLARTLKR